MTRNIGSGKARKTRKRPRPLRHRWFDDWITARDAQLKELVQSIAQDVLDYEKQQLIRKRARRNADERHFRTIIELVVCNLAYAVINPPKTGRIATRLGHQSKSRYDNPALGKPFSALLHVLNELGWLELQFSKAVRGEAASISPTAKFADEVHRLGIRLESFGRQEGEEVIILTQRPRRRAQSGGASKRRIKLEYPDCHESHAYRDQITRLNDFLGHADITFIDDGLDPIVDPNIVTLRRHFVVLQDQGPRFDQAGRIFGGFWQHISRARRANIRINGEPVVELDYGQMFTRLAYADIGKRPPEGDLYNIPGLEAYRSGVKLAMNTLLFDDHLKRNQWPQEMGIGVGTDEDASQQPEKFSEFDGLLPEGWGVSKTKKAILTVHPELGAAWGRALGYHLMFVESEILITGMLKLMDVGVVSLGLHDGLIVGKSDQQVAREVMARVASEHVGVEIPITVKNGTTA